jgi:hypothetical protein
VRSAAGAACVQPIRRSRAAMIVSLGSRGLRETPKPAPPSRNSITDVSSLPGPGGPPGRAPSPRAGRRRPTSDLGHWPPGDPAVLPGPGFAPVAGERRHHAPQAAFRAGPRSRGRSDSGGAGGSGARRALLHAPTACQGCGRPGPARAGRSAHVWPLRHPAPGHPRGAAARARCPRHRLGRRARSRSPPAPSAWTTWSRTSWPAWRRLVRARTC